jgi:hypothetical protein
VVNETISLDVKFPYYGWWNHKKDSIVKLLPVYYPHDKSLLNYIQVTKVVKGFSLNTCITSEVIRVSNNVIDERITYILRDYSTVATEQEFRNFRIETLNELE